MTKKKAIIIGAICIVILVIMSGFLIFGHSFKNKKPINISSGQNLETKETTPSEARGKDIPAPSTAIILKINDVKIGLTAKKTFVKYADQDINLTTSTVNGHGWIDPISKSYFLKANFNFSTLLDSKDKPNEELLKNMADKNFYADLYVEDEEVIDLQNEIKLRVPVLVTLNGVTRNEIFSLDIVPTNNSIQATGETEINLSDYHINPPEVKDVYSYEDKVKLFYEVNGIIL